MPVPKGLECRKTRNRGTEERDMLIRVREEELHSQVVSRAQAEVEVGIELIFVVVSGHDCGVVNSVSRGLWTWNHECSIGILRVQQVERDRIYVRAVRSHCHTSKCPGLTPEYCSEGRLRADQGNGRKA